MQKFDEKRTFLDKAMVFLLKLTMFNRETSTMLSLSTAMIKRLFVLLQDFKENEIALQNMCTPSLFRELKSHHEFFEENNAKLKLSVNVKEPVRLGTVNIGVTDLDNSTDFLESATKVQNDNDRLERSHIGNIGVELI